MPSSATFMSWPSRTLTEIDHTRFKRLVVSPPQMRLRKVLMGIMSTSSWSWPLEFWPLGSSTPTTFIGTPRTRTTCSKGSSSPNNSRAAVAPIHATLAEPESSAASNIRPEAKPQSRASRYSLVTPKILVPQLMLPATSCPVVREVGAAT